MPRCDWCSSAACYEVSEYRPDSPVYCCACCLDAPVALLKAFGMEAFVTALPWAVRA